MFVSLLGRGPGSHARQAGPMPLSHPQGTDASEKLVQEGTCAHIVHKAGTMLAPEPGKRHHWKREPGLGRWLKVKVGKGLSWAKTRT